MRPSSRNLLFADVVSWAIAPSPSCLRLRLAALLMVGTAHVSSLQNNQDGHEMVWSLEC